METLDLIVNWINDKMSLILTVLIFIVGLFLTIRFRFRQTTLLGRGIKHTFVGEKDAKGDVSSFAAFCTALSATIGTGNIVGVATALCAGGPGALFWMIIAAVLGMATKYAECLLAVKYRRQNEDGSFTGGPFTYIEDGMGKKWKWLAITFAVCGIACCLLGVGSFSQINSMSSALNVLIPTGVVFYVGSTPITWTIIIGGALLGIVIAFVILGGLKSISKVSTIVVPFMAILYILLCIVVLCSNVTLIPEAFRQIVVGAFNPQAVTGGVVGSFIVAMQKGVARGIFSNEAGLGSAPIAAAAAKTNSPARQGLIGMTGVFFDTIIICMLTGLTIVLTGAWNTGAEGFDVTVFAFTSAIPYIPSGLISAILAICLLFFAFTTILGWSYYSDRCVSYLTGGKKGWSLALKIVHIALIFIGPYLTISLVWNIADVVNSFMAIPNIIALIALSGVVVKETKEYLNANKVKPLSGEENLNKGE